MKGILRLILIFIVMFYFIKFITKLFALFKPQNNIHNNPGNDDFVDYRQHHKSKKSNDPKGEYVDFEEVK